MTGQELRAAGYTQDREYPNLSLGEWSIWKKVLELIAKDVDRTLWYMMKDYCEKSTNLFLPGYFYLDEIKLWVSKNQALFGKQVPDESFFARIGDHIAELQQYDLILPDCIEYEIDPAKPDYYTLWYK
jgi:hypothetical protein